MCAKQSETSPDKNFCLSANKRKLCVTANGLTFFFNSVMLRGNFKEDDLSKSGISVFLFFFYDGILSNLVRNKH